MKISLIKQSINFRGSVHYHPGRKPGWHLAGRRGAGGAKSSTSWSEGGPEETRILETLSMETSKTIPPQWHTPSNEATPTPRLPMGQAYSNHHSYHTIQPIYSGHKIKYIHKTNQHTGKWNWSGIYFIQFIYLLLKISSSRGVLKSACLPRHTVPRTIFRSQVSPYIMGSTDQILITRFTWQALLPTKPSCQPYFYFLKEELHM